MKLILACVTLLMACVPYADLREYHYNRPQQPLQAGLTPQIAIQPQATARYYTAPTIQQPATTSTANVVLQNFGQAGTAHIARQLPAVVASQGANGYLPPQYQNSNGANQAYYNQASNNAVAAVVASYYPQQQGQQQQYYTPNVNPLTQYSQQQQQQQGPRYVNLPQPQQQYGQQGFANGQQQLAQQQQQYAAGAASYNGGGAGAGAGGSFGQTLPLNGNFVSQSEAGQLHSYQHQQQPSGDTRPFARKITTCYPGGQCQSVTLGPGQPDQRHQHIVAATRAKTVPSTDKCRLIAEANKAQAIANQYGAGGGYAGNSYNNAAAGGYAGGSYGHGAANGQGGAYAGGSYGHGAANSQGGAYAGGSYGIGAANSQAHGAQGHHHASEPAGPIRPHDRRLFPYSEVVLPKDPYN